MTSGKEWIWSGGAVVVVIARVAFKLIGGVGSLPSQRRVPLPRVKPNDFSRNSSR
jgi:hypothetical protein